MDTQGPSPSRPCLSVAMILRDDQEVLQATLESARPVADEIVLLATCPCGQTAAIGERCGATVLEGTGASDASAARNHLLEKVTGDWVLWLEPGERLVEPGRSQLRAFLDRKADSARVYSIMVETPPPDPGGSPEQAAQVRLMPNRPDLWFEGRVRETLKPSIESAGLEADVAPGRIVRHPRQHDPAYKAQRAREQMELAKLEWLQSDRPEARTLLAMGEAAGDLNERAAAREAFARAVRAAQRGSTEMLEAYYGLLATFEGDPQAARRPLAVCVEALEVFPQDAQLLCALGNYLQSENQIELAARAFEAAVRFGQVNVETWHLGDVAEVAAAGLGLTLQLLDRDGEAQTALDEALRRHPGSVRLRRHLIDLYVKQGRVEEAVALADGLPMAVEEREPLQSAIRGACLAARQDWVPALGYLQSAYVSGCSDPVCLRWLSVTLLSNGQTEAALPVLHLWRQREPHNREVQAYLAAIEARASAPAWAGAPSAVRSEEGHWHRIDPAGTVLAAPTWPIPIVSQTFSTG